MFEHHFSPCHSSKAEIQFLQGTKQLSKLYEYKLKSIIKRKVSTLLKKELPLLSHLFPNLDLTKNSKEEGLIGRYTLLNELSLVARRIMYYQSVH